MLFITAISFLEDVISHTRPKKCVSSNVFRNHVYFKLLQYCETVSVDHVQIGVYPHFSLENI